MGDTRQFNSLPLLSAKHGLDSSLAVLGSELEAYFAEGISGTQHLQLALAELHRIAGVLRILSLDGAAVFCNEFETVLNEVKTQQQAPSAMQREVVLGAMQALTHYLDALASGAPNTALRLFYTYQELHQLRGLESAFEVDLFFPDLNVTLPSSILASPADTAAAAHIKTARAHYQQDLLKWLRQQDNHADALRGMRAAVETVMTCVAQNQERAFWWVATGLLDCLILGGLPPELNAKKLLGRIDLQMKSLSEGSHADEYATMCEMLYMVARSHSVSDTVESIKQLYSLSSYLPEDPPLPPGESAQVLAQMHQLLNTVQETLEGCAKGDVATCQSFNEQVEQLYALSENLDRNTLQFLCKQMYSAVSNPDDQEAVHQVKMDMTMALLLLGHGIDHYLSLGSNFHEQARIIGQRLQAGVNLASVDDGSLEHLVALHCQGAEQEVLMPLAGEMKNNLQRVEQVLSAFFNDNGTRGELAPLRVQLSQIHGGLYMLALETPAKLLDALMHVVERYATGANPTEAEMRDIASAVSALDAYLHDLTQGQKSDSSALEALIAALHVEHAAITPMALPVAEAPAGVSIREGGEDDELLEVFLEEAQEVLETLHGNLLECQTNPQNKESLITIRRSFHTLKGSGRMVGLTSLGEVAWALERAMNKWLQEEKPATSALLEMIGDAEVLFQHWVDRLRNGGNAMIDTVALLAAAQRIESGADVAAPTGKTQAARAEAPLEQALEKQTQEAEKAEQKSGAQGVVIGEVNISPVLFKIATEEASTNIEALQHHAVTLREIDKPVVTYDFMRAAHTLAGVNRTMGIEQIAELASALELWLQTHMDGPTALDEAQLELLDQTIARLGEMNQTLRSMQEPQHQPELIARLHASKNQAAAIVQEYAPTPDSLPIDQDVMAGEEPQLRLDEQGLALSDEKNAIESISGKLGLPAELLLAEPAQEKQDIEFGLEGLLEPENLHVQEETRTLELLPPGTFNEPVLSDEIQQGAAAEMAHTTPTPEQIDTDINLKPYAEHHAHQASGAEQAQELPVAAWDGEAAAAKVEQLDELSAIADAEEELIRGQQVPKTRTVQDDLDAQLLPIFLEEADELYPQISSEMRAWREQPDNSSEGLKNARKLQRSLHTLKGSARMAGAMRLGELTHRVEDCLEKALAADGRQEAALLDELDNYFDRIANALEQLRQGKAMEGLEPATEGAVPESAAEIDAAAPITEMVHQGSEVILSDNKIAQQAATQPENLPEGVEERGTTAMLRVRSDTVDDLVNEAGEISVARSRIEIELRAFKDGLLELTGSVNSLRKQLREIEIHAEGQMQARITVAGDSAEKFDPLEFDRFTRFQELTRFMNESVHDVQTVQQSLLKNMDETAAAMSAQAHLNRELQQSLMSIRMLPFSSISQRLYRTVRQTGKELNKRVNLELRGTEVELDRSVLEKMTAPFEHLLRNSIVHGLEDEAQRKAKGKPPLGNITLSLRQEGNEVVFEFADDGAGLNLPKLRQKGMERGLLQQGETASDDQVVQLIFATGLSTASELTEISGRGVGMDVVRSEITGLGGRIDVFSESGKGTRFVIYLPLTLAVMKTLIVRAVQQLYAIPSVMVEQVRQIKPAALEALYREGNVEWQDKIYPLQYLPSLLGDNEHQPEIKPYNAVLLLRSGEQRMALHMDELLGNEEVVVKNIGPQLARLPGIAGATVQGDGNVLLILNPLQLQHQVETRHEVTAAPVVEPVRLSPLVMVVDDSLTVRKITSRLLGRAGYQVVTAKDGVDALEQLVDMTPDLMLLDVEMPRMDGFELAKQLRRNAKTLYMPIIMITSRTAEKHKNFALELGVDEYMGKPYQEDELLSTIARLISAHAMA